MADINILKPYILKWEGGFANDPTDRGGATNMGVTFNTFKDYRKQKGLPETTIGDLKNLSDNEWTDILRTLYWNRWKADDIECQSVANILVDWVWCSGVYGIKNPQKVLGVTADGIVGRATLATVNGYPNQTELFERLKQARLDYVDNICRVHPEQSKFQSGWHNRINAFTFK